MKSFTLNYISMSLILLLIANKSFANLINNSMKQQNSTKFLEIIDNSILSRKTNEPFRSFISLGVIGKIRLSSSFIKYSI